MSSSQDPGTHLTRRGFVRSCAAGCAAAGSSGLLGSLSGQEASGPVDCSGPTPPASAIESRREPAGRMPMPAAPLRNAKQKTPPIPSPLIGKIALGPMKTVTRDDQEVTYRDWMSDPNDARSLLASMGGQLGMQYRAVETDIGDFSYDPRELPVLLFSGHNHFALDDRVRASLQRFVLDGGTIIGDACCGWKDFDESFRREMEWIFPQRPMRKLMPDDPIFSSHSRLETFTYQEADGTRYEDAPCLEGISIGCRTAVIYSPIDMSCGWDGHDHPRGLRVVIDQAKQVGLNYLTYMLASYPLGRFLSTTKVYHEAAAPTRDDFVMAQLIHDGDWDPDPSAVHNLLRYVRDHSTMEVKFKRADVRLDDQQAADYPLLYMTGHHDFAWTDTEADKLRRYLQAGGMLIADACCGRLAFDRAFRAQLARVLPDSELERIPLDHPVYHIHEDITRVEYTPRTQVDFGDTQTPSLEGVTIDGRLVVIYSRFDLGDGWERFDHPYAYGYSSEDALRIGANLLVYAMTH